MEKLYINIPAGDDIIEDKSMKNSLFFKNLQNKASEDEYGSDSHFKTTLMTVLLKKNKLIYIIDEVVETAFKLNNNFIEETEEEKDIERILIELVEDGYFVEIGN